MDNSNFSVPHRVRGTSEQHTQDLSQSMQDNKSSALDNPHMYTVHIYMYFINHEALY